MAAGTFDMTMFANVPDVIYNSGVSRSRKASMAKVIELLKQYIEERKIDMKKWQLCIGFGYDREEAAAFQKQL